MFVSMLTPHLIVRRSGLKVKNVPALPARQEKGRAVKPAQVNYLFFRWRCVKRRVRPTGMVSSWMLKPLPSALRMGIQRLPGRVADW
jgi:hypothetical protein